MYCFHKQTIPETCASFAKAPREPPNPSTLSPRSVFVQVLEKLKPAAVLVEQLLLLKHPMRLSPPLRIPKPLRRRRRRMRSTESDEEYQHHHHHSGVDLAQPRSLDLMTLYSTSSQTGNLEKGDPPNLAAEPHWASAEPGRAQLCVDNVAHTRADRPAIAIDWILGKACIPSQAQNL
ncbi:hypothetical protein KC19_7G141700 [Ceratodon purpureus]|uniref:Uncharacterized protein n=1 Tax=Ceratodon purpureus TaxID=3225 RepID=A0A8T0HBJ5_CERPU|nr:hypothetical protein KC19_7G141700 [Ceratodon purpureus]